MNMNVNVNAVEVERWITVRMCGGCLA